MIMIKKTIKHFPVLLLYLVGMAGFVFADIIIARYYPVEEVEVWAFVKSILLLSASVCILGLDQVIVREPRALKKILRFFIIRGFFISIFVAIVLNYFSNGINIFTWLFLVVNLTFLSFMFAVYRGSLNMFRAQLALNGWKFVFVLVVIFFIGSGISIGTSLFISLSLSSVIVIFIMISNRDWMSLYKKESNLNENKLISQSYKFVILSLSLNLSINFEQIAINTIGKGDGTAIIFAHFTIFLPLIIFLNGFIGFYLGPLMRSIRLKFNLGYYYRMLSLFIILSILLGFLSYSFGVFAFNFLYYNKYELVNSIAIPTVFIGVFRLLYALPSSYISILGSEKLLFAFSKSNMYFVSLFFIFVSILFFIGVPIIYSVLIGSLSNWMLRVLFGNYLSILELRKC